MNRNVLQQDIALVEADAVVVGFHEDVRPLKGGAGRIDWLLCGALSRLILDGKLRGVPGEVALLTSSGKVPAQKIFLVGLGPRAGASPALLQQAAEKAAESVVRAGASRAAVDLFAGDSDPAQDMVQAVRDGLSAGAAGRSLWAALVSHAAA